MVSSAFLGRRGKTSELIMTKKPLQVMVLYTDGCTGASPMAKLVEKTAASMGIAIELQMLLITTQAQAEELHFYGSPTVQINGLDMEPAARGSRAVGFT